MSDPIIKNPMTCREQANREENRKRCLLSDNDLISEQMEQPSFPSQQKSLTEKAAQAIAAKDARIEETKTQLDTEIRNLLSERTDYFQNPDVNISSLRSMSQNTLTHPDYLIIIINITDINLNNLINLVNNPENINSKELLNFDFQDLQRIRQFVEETSDIDFSSLGGSFPGLELGIKYQELAIKIDLLNINNQEELDNILREKFDQLMQFFQQVSTTLLLVTSSIYNMPTQDHIPTTQ